MESAARPVQPQMTISPLSTTPIPDGRSPVPIPWLSRPIRTGSGAWPTTVHQRGDARGLRTIAARDSRIVVTHAARNGGTAPASNLASSRATGTYVALLDYDDALMPHALHRMVEHLNGAGRDVDVLYSDEDKLELDGTRCDACSNPTGRPIRSARRCMRVTCWSSGDR